MAAAARRMLTAHQGNYVMTDSAFKILIPHARMTVIVIQVMNVLRDCAGLPIATLISQKHAGRVGLVLTGAVCPWVGVRTALGVGRVMNVLTGIAS